MITIITIIASLYSHLCSNLLVTAFPPSSYLLSYFFLYFPLFAFNHVITHHQNHKETPLSTLPSNSHPVYFPFFSLSLFCPQNHKETPLSPPGGCYPQTLIPRNNSMHIKPPVAANGANPPSQVIYI